MAGKAIADSWGADKLPPDDPDYKDHLDQAGAAISAGTGSMVQTIANNWGSDKSHLQQTIEAVGAFFAGSPSSGNQPKK